ncbi:MAG: phosphoribosylaminoimidazolesuccinocarboxamide synthase [Chloroherpetonaceae bacterium]|nr:phosphoribosylaminoimidazolesuccinocarboxamide synthase [Chloroherpetonaceae bacterium]
MIKLHQLYEGKAKKVFASSNPLLIIQEFKDDATAFNAQKKGTIADKGIINNALSEYFFNKISLAGIPTHFVEKLSPREMLCKKLDIIKIEVVTRNIAAGSLVRKFGLIEGDALQFPIVELYLKNDELGDPMMSEDHAKAFGLATHEELQILRQFSLSINSILQTELKSVGLLLVDFKLEFGKHKGEILLGDEISPDTCRLWDIETLQKLDKDRFRFDLGKVEDAYQEVYRRIFGQSLSNSQ